MPTVFIPPVLRQFTAGAAQVPAVGSTLREVILDVQRQHPGLQPRVLQDGSLRPEVFLTVGAVEAFGLDIPIGPDDEVFIVPAIAGGSETVLAHREKEAVAELCAKLRAVRLASKLSQAEVAQAVGTSQARISRIEAGIDIPRLDLMMRLCQLFGVSITMDTSGTSS